MIIYGWGKTTIKEFGPTQAYKCGHCQNEKPWVLQRITTWFTLFFIPIIPYSIKKVLLCPVCRHGSELTGDLFEKLKPTAINNQLLLSGKISKQEYEMRLIQAKNPDLK